MKFLNNKYLSLILRVAVGLVFLIAGLGKAADPASFAREMQNYQIIPFALINIMALIMPWIEIIVGIFLIAGVRIKANAAIASGFMLIFIIAIGSAMLRGLNINCGCFSGHTVLVGWPKLMQNIGWMTCSLLLFFFPVQSFSIENFASTKSDISD
jgi:uncharacterized membrane protein YphA (DoxX/SURF4 family)